jgi:uncharacterized protein
MPPASLLIKPVSGRCNLACTYCFYRDVAEHRETRDYGRMSPETVDCLVGAALDYAQGSCSFAFQGGEPTLAGLDFYRDFVRKVREKDAGRSEIRFSIQTNGMLIDREWAAFLKEEHFLTGLSLDGPRMIHDAFRSAPDGSASFARVMEAAAILKEASADFNILCVVDTLSADNPLPVYDFFRRRGFDWIQYIPCLEPLGGTKDGSPWSLGPAAWASFLKTTFDAWHADIRSGRKVSVRYFDNLVDMALGYPPENCGMAGTCGAYFTVEADGSVFPCDFYVLDEWRMGNVRSDSFAAMAASESARRFVEVSDFVSAECKTCFAYPLCRGGCRRDREPFDSGHPRLNRYCEAYKDFFAHAGQRIMDLARELAGSAEEAAKRAKE